jgi:signal-transduction protein with cAMP-binding, CBS, and nucleotidyltransferase domain
MNERKETEMTATHDEAEQGLAATQQAGGRPEDLRAVQEWALRFPIIDVMTRPPLFCDPEVTIHAAAETMASQGVGSLILLRPDGPSAILTERDLVRAIADRLNPDLTWAVEVASEDIVALRSDDTVRDAIESMVACGIHHLPVKRDGTVIGMVSASDLLVTLSDLTLGVAPD